MLTDKTLANTLRQLDGSSYKAYKDIKGSYEFPDFTLIIDHVQGDPFASPSKLIIKVPQSVAQFPSSLYSSTSRTIALEDYLTRQFADAAKASSAHRGTGKSGLISIAFLGQEVLPRTSAFINDEFLEIRFLVGLPARGRSILGIQAKVMLCEDIPDIVDNALKYKALNGEDIQKQVETIEDADWLRQQLPSQGLVSFIANDSILPRNSGVDPRPLKDNPLPFVSPPSLEVSFNCPNRGKITGMGIPMGVSLIVGGGYHGKSTLLKAVELGVYNHIPGDGREFVVTNPTAMKIRAEDGRSVVGENLSPFINQLPQGRSTTNFSSANASGSTSQAANIIEALEAGTKLLLLDEDTSATNFMIRDHRMQQLISKDKEPITPFIDKVKQLYGDYGVSTVLVMGGSGDYFDVADLVIAMDNFKPQDFTKEAKIIAEKHFTERLAEGGDRFGEITPRIPLTQSIDPSRGHKAVKLKVRDVDNLGFGTQDIDLASVAQIVDSGQLKAIALAIVYAKEKYLSQKLALPQLLEKVMVDISSQGLDILSDFPQGDLALFRPLELAAAINRLRTLEII